MTKISVCLASHNGEKYIKAQIDSILPQLNEEDELIISDDGSTDTTISIIHSYRDKRIKLTTCDVRDNAIKNFENALTRCSGEVIFLADQDDLWAPNKIETMLKALKTYDIVLSDCCVVNENLELLCPSLFGINKTRTGFWKNLWKNGYVGCCMAFHRKILNKALPFPAHIPMHDQWIGLVGELFYKPVAIKDPLTMYRRHEKSTTKTGDKSHFSLISKIRFRINLIKNLIRLYV
ncbi:Alpha-L-Rha alpha-1,3-L-rhamnosyltransferase [Fulvivirga imtechensis AK7]|uniref:Alpha-L-Rha alpha-1,3-L-rhamnosyltransferase n=1 Tax=Fulvivirga imtechensis AK7 TaxID=1237149 RepID=L8JQJ1_9BACT|nr:glycosyltransferase family 2 protein [Fulvivirga imtechensis]ELR71221.1 Alpha-L-Rha alpha-1,3-L-rhamnosyltransferase [Fulvivirga imtechensis AK7]